MNMFPDRCWYLYDNTSGRIVLKHPYREGDSVPCPHCDAILAIEDYRAACCGKTFKTGFGEIAQREPVGISQRSTGRGWGSLRPYEPS